MNAGARLLRCPPRAADPRAVSIGTAPANTSCGRSAPPKEDVMYEEALLTLLAIGALLLLI